MPEAGHCSCVKYTIKMIKHPLFILGNVNSYIVKRDLYWLIQY